MSEKLPISLVMPAKNEGEGIQSVIQECLPYADEILVIDGHSTDDTFEKAQALGVQVVKDHGKGKGEAIRMSLSMVKHDVIVFIDVDGSHEPADIPKIAGPVLQDKADLVVASRIMGGSDEFYMRVGHFMRVLGGCGVSMITNYRFNANLTDTGNGFRAIKKEVAQKLDMKAVSFDIEQEMVLKALKKKYRVMEVGSHEYARKWGEPKLRLYHGWRHILGLLLNII